MSAPFSLESLFDDPIQLTADAFDTTPVGGGLASHVSQYSVDIEKTREYITQYRTRGDLEAKELAVLHNVGLAIPVVKGAYRRAAIQHASIGSDDLLQEAVMGLGRVVEVYDPQTATFKFSTQAVHSMRNTVNRAIDNQNIIRIPIHVQTGIRQLQSHESEFAATEGRTPGISDLFEQEGPSAEALAAAHEEGRHLELPTGCHPQRQADRELHIQRLARASGKDVSKVHHYLTAHALRRVDLLTWLPQDSEAFIDKNAPNPLAEVIIKERAETTENALDGLPEREKVILQLLHGWDYEEEWKFREIADKFNVTTERIRQISRNAIWKLRLADEFHQVLEDFSGDSLADVDSPPRKPVMPPKHRAVGKRFTSNDDPQRKDFVKKVRAQNQERAARKRKYAAQDAAKRRNARDYHKRLSSLAV